MNNLLKINNYTNYSSYNKSIILSLEDKIKLKKNIINLLKVRNAVIIAHYYTDPEIQALAEITGGCVADSLDMARFGNTNVATTLIIAGVRFMGETAKILNPTKTILMPTLKAECSLDLSCPEEAFNNFCNAHSDRTVVVYANTSASVKARADWVVTSSIAVKLINYLDSLGKKILWAPDRHLGKYLQKKTSADIICWQGSCIVHEEFKTQGLIRMKKLYPNAAVLVHPESPQGIIDLADEVGSTNQLINAARTLPNKQIIVATDRGIFYKMQQVCLEKILLEAPTAGEGATCYSCAHCPWMAMNNLQLIAQGLEHGGVFHEIKIEKKLREKALIPINRMLSFAANYK